mgnify:FL=1
MSVDKFEILKKLVEFDNYLDIMTKSIDYNLTHEKLEPAMRLKVKYAKKTLDRLYDFVETNTFDSRFRDEKYKRDFVKDHTAFKLEGGADMYAIIDDKHTVEACDGAVTMPTKDFIQSQVGTTNLKDNMNDPLK